MSEEDRIKYPLYIKFQEQFGEQHLKDKKNEKIKLISLSSQKISEFCRLQNADVQSEYEKIKYHLKNA